LWAPLSSRLSLRGRNGRVVGRRGKRKRLAIDRQRAVSFPLHGDNLANHQEEYVLQPKQL
jgi:hypothetical protein